jgi:hypothetical protein
MCAPTLTSVNPGSQTGAAASRGIVIRNYLLQMLIDLIAQNWADTKIRVFTDVRLPTD